MALRLTSRAATALLAFSFLLACSKKSSDNPNPTPAQGMSWTVDGSNVTAVTSAALVLGARVIVTGSSATSGTGNSILLDIPKRTGTFVLGDTTTTTGSYIMAGTTSYDATSGTIVVTAYTPSTAAGASNIAGTYNFTGKLTTGTATKTITNGSFNVKY